MDMVWRFLRVFRWALLALIAFVVGALAVLTLTEKGRDNLAGIISDFASSGDSKVRISGIDGIWSGNLTVESLVLEDADGPWLAVRDAAIDWSPLALFSAELRTERVHARRIEFARLPRTNSTSGGGGGLPVSLSVKGIDLPDVALGADLAGGVASVSAKGFMLVDDDPMTVDSELDIARTDGGEGSIAAKVSFVPAQNRLDIDIVGSEPKGGIIANLLKLPGEPAVDILVSGSGPADKWSGTGTVSIDKVVVTRLTGMHAFTDAGSRVEAKGDGEFARFLPERFRPILSGRTVFDIAGTLTTEGGIVVERAEIESNALTGTAKGTINPAGATDFALELTAAGQGLPLVFGSDESPIDINVASATVRAFGDGRTPALDISAVLPSFATKTVSLNGVAIALHSEEFDVRNRIGPVSGSLVAGSLVIDNPTIAPLVAGEVRAELAGTLSTESFVVQSGTFRSDAINGTLAGTIALTDGVITLDLDAEVLSAALPAAARRALDDKVVVSAELLRDSEGNLSANSLSLASGGLSAGGVIRFAEETVDADIKGRIADLSSLSPGATGAVDFAVTASGDRNRPDLDATVTSERIAAAGRELTGLNLTAKGGSDLSALAIGLDGNLSGQPLKGTATVSLAGDQRAVRDIALTLGGNRISGSLTLDEDFTPLGTLDLDLPALAAVAAPDNPDLKAALRGTANFERDGDKPFLTINGTADVTSGTTTANGLNVNAEITDFIRAPLLDLTVDGSARAGATEIRDIMLSVTGTPQALPFAATATLGGIPVDVRGAVRSGDGGVTVDIDTAAATVQGNRVELSEPAAIGSADGVIRLDGLTLDLGGGKAVISGTTGETLDLDVTLAGVPASLANAYVNGLDAQGLIDGTAKITGQSSAPSVAYDLRWTGAQVAQTRSFGPLTVTSKGSFADNALTFDAAANGASGLSVTAGGKAALAGETIEADLTGRLADVAPLAAGAEGSIDFSVKASGARAAPDLAVTIGSQRLRAAGREITGLQLNATGKADAANPAATVALTGDIGGQRLDGKAVLATANGKSTIDDLLVTLGQNRIAGDLELDDAFVPVGTVDFSIPDLAPLAALAFEEISGSVTGNARFSRANGVPRLVADATVANFRRGELGGDNISIGATVDDYLAAPTVIGRVEAARITSGATAVTGISIDLSRDGAWTGFEGGATVSGIPARATGRVQAADGTTTIELSVAEATVQGIRAALAGASTVRIAEGRTTLDNLTLALGSGRAVVSGTAGETLDLDVRLSSLPASLANSVAAGLGASGTISGTVDVTGQASAPSVAYNVNWSGAEVTQTRAAGIGALSVQSAGTFAANRLSFNATAGGAGGLSIRAGGNVNTAAGPSLDLTVAGTVPYSILSGRLAASGLALSGSANVDLRITGTASNPVIGGSIRSAGARLIDSGTGLALNGIDADIGIGNGVATVRRLGGSLSGGGSVSVTGTVGINPGSGFPADLSIRLAEARYTDGRVVTANLGGVLAIRGPLASRPTLAGTINLARTVITIPERLPSSLANLDVKHKNAPAAVRKQDNALNPGGEASGGGGGLALDLTINAPERIFVQGRGLDAELGGSLRLTGSTASPNAVGQFDLRRGRLQVLGKRLTFTSGTLGFSGSLVPYIDLTAESTATDATAIVKVSGPANNPRFTFSSIPALPEDEVLARLIFGRSMSNLSPIQIVQLADAVAQLSGGGGTTGLLQSLRSKIGVDDLDIKTDEKGGTSVAAGKYLNDRTYLSLEKGEKPGSGKATIDLDVGKGVKLRGQATDAGEAKGGIFYEQEY